MEEHVCAAHRPLKVTLETLIRCGERERRSVLCEPTLATHRDLASTTNRNPSGVLDKALALCGCALNANVQLLEECTVIMAVCQLMDKKRRSYRKWLRLKRGTTFIPQNRGPIAAISRLNTLILLF